MKTIRLIIAGLVMTMGFSSCSSLFYDAKVDVLNSIQKGMSRQEVTKILGTPEYRRFDRDIEEWEYSRVLSGKSNISRRWESRCNGLILRRATYVAGCSQ